MLPNGDYVAVGWAEDLRGKPDGWLTRITRDGDIVWNLAAVHDQDQRFYSVKRLSNGNLVAVGRVQQGPDSKQSARGYVVVFDQTDGRQIARHEFAFSPNTLRSAFQDVAEMADGSLLFVGWMTKTDGTDDIWLLKTTPDGKWIKSVSFGESFNDVAYSVTRFGTGIAIAGTLRKARDTSLGSLILFDKDLANRTVLNLDRWRSGNSQAKAILELPSIGLVILAGQIAKGKNADPVALTAVIDTQKSTASIEEAGADTGTSTFRGVAFDAAGHLAVVGDAREAKDRPLRGLIGVSTNAPACRSEAGGDVSAHSLSSRICAILAARRRISPRAS
jgi:hypothetical protein